MLLRTTILAIGVKFGSIALAILSVYLLATLLGPEGYGEYAYAMGVVAALSFPARGGIPHLATRELAYATVDEQPALARGVARRSTQAVLFISICTAVTAFAFSELPSQTTPDTTKYALLLLPPIALGSIRSALLRGIKRVIAAQLPEYIFRPTLFITFLAILEVSHSPTTPKKAIAAHVVAGFITFVLGTRILKRYAPRLFSGPPPIFDDRRWLRTALPFTLIGGAEILLPQIPIIALGILSSLENVAFFRVGSQIGVILLLSLTMITSIVSPHIASAFRAGNHQRVQALARATSRIALIFSLPALLAFTLVGQSLLPLIDTRYTEAFYPALILSIGFLFKACFAGVDTILKMTEQEGAAWRASAISLPVCVFASFTLIPKFGLNGAAIASAATTVFWTCALLVLARRRSPIRFGPL